MLFVSFIRRRTRTTPKGMSATTTHVRVAALCPSCILDSCTIATKSVKHRKRFCSCHVLKKDAAGPRHNTWVISYESTLVNCLKHMGIMPGATSRGSPTFARAALSITSLKPILLVICLCGSSWGVESDEEAAVNSAIGRSSLTSGFTVWSSTGCDCLFSSISIIFEMNLDGSSTEKDFVFVDTSLPFLCGRRGALEGTHLDVRAPIAGVLRNRPSGPCAWMCTLGETCEIGRSEFGFHLDGELNRDG